MKKIMIITALIFTMTFIFYMSAQPAEDSSGMSEGVCRVICRTFVVNYETLSPAEQQQMVDDIGFFVRKGAHCCEYMVLGILLYLTLGFYIGRRRYIWCTSFAIGVFYAVTDEIHQYFVPGRSCEFRDIMIDSAGVLIGVTALLLITGFRIVKDV